MTARTPPNNAPKTRGRPFPPGNPGRPKGSRHRLTVLAEKLMEDDAEEVVRAVIAAAKGGDMTAARLVLERISPPRKGRPVTFDLAPGETADDILTALGGVVRAVAGGDLTCSPALPGRACRRCTVESGPWGRGGTAPPPLGLNLTLFQA